MSNRRAARSPKQKAAMRTTTGAAVPAQQPRRDPDQTFDPRTFPQPPMPWYDYTFRRWVFPVPDAARWGRPRDRFKSWEDERR